MPDAFDIGAVAVGAHLIIDPLGGAAQRQLAQRHQIALAEEVLDGAFSLAWQIDLALFETLAQIIRRQVDENDLVGGIK